MDRVAVVTGANKGIGLEICKQLASNGVFVVLTARDVNRGNEAIKTLASIGISNVVFHPLDVVDRTSVNSLADFVKARFGKLDILVNNAGVTGATVMKKDLVLTEDNITGPQAKSTKEFIEETYELAEKCLRTNYYGVKQVTSALLPLLQQSNSAKVVNVSSSLGQLQFIPGENIKEELNDVDSLTEEKVDGLVVRFLEDMKEDRLETGGWPIIYSAYIVSKATLNAYTRVLAKKYPDITINAVTPGFVKTNLNHNSGILPVEEGARGPVMVALMPKEGPSGLFFDRTVVSVAVVTGANKGIGFEICKQLASNGVFVVLTARDVNRGNEAIEKLASSGISNVVFHPLDVVDGTSIHSLADFVKARFGKLDILVNNAGVAGAVMNKDLVLTRDKITGPQAKSSKEFIEETYELAEKCLRTNYYGIKQVTAALLPLLQQSNSAKVVNVSSGLGQLQYIPGENIKEQFNDIDSLTEEKVDGLVVRFLEDMKEDRLETGGWPIIVSSYIVSKATLNAYTRVLAQKYPGIAINAVHPGFVKTDLNHNTGFLPVEEGARGPVMLALMPKEGPSGLFFDRTVVSTF
ncbi:salutaridine reductase-like [Syzygium oleosum]|uniref:salutaridine reductase-like n=1 Tax=Syzygium oleosum TaxID=219896 RepID=UPI0024B9BA5A|nr:salutaridine reductase-like [Syzygium oleosum]